MSLWQGEEAILPIQLIDLEGSCKRQIRLPFCITTIYMIMRLTLLKNPAIKSYREINPIMLGGLSAIA